MGNGILKNLSYLVNCLLKVVYCGEDSCLTCGGESEGEFLCNECRKKINLCRESFLIQKEGEQFLCYSAAYYSSVVTELIIKLKYKGDFRAGQILANYMINLIECNAIEYDVITFVPSSKVSIKKRGYNQSEYLAKIISRHFRKPMVNCICKSNLSLDQIGLDTEQRWNNLKNSFEIRNSKEIKNKKILLIDDVITTGATAFYCCRELIKNNAFQVKVLTAAKSRI